MSGLKVEKAVQLRCIYPSCNPSSSWKKPRCICNSAVLLLTVYGEDFHRLVGDISRGPFQVSIASLLLHYHCRGHHTSVAAGGQRCHRALECVKWANAHGYFPRAPLHLKS
eukprot:3489132-Amphidinium_carterae.2